MLNTQHFAISSFILLTWYFAANCSPFEIRKGEHLTTSKIMFCLNLEQMDIYHIPWKEITDIKWTRAVLSVCICISNETADKHNGNENFIILLIKSKEKKPVSFSCVLLHLHIRLINSVGDFQWAICLVCLLFLSFQCFLWGLASSK